ncbi:hypothetical protein N0V88_005604 [Collariella sp. IMI 366227]|nr:hypothetical protein N0V88_005604 [Collariella sp. IMI 366227]
MQPDIPDSALTPDSDQPSSKLQRPQRVLACVSCQQRKVKCNRRFPCDTCIRAGTQCVPATVPRQRRRRFPERELLARLRGYEDLLRQHHIAFEPLHPPTGETATTAAAETKLAKTPAKEKVGDTEAARSPETPEQNKAGRNLWNAISLQENHDAHGDDGSIHDDDKFDDTGFLSGRDDLHGAVIKKAWDHAYRDHDASDHHLLFGSPASNNVDLTTLHPDQTKIFRLWQIYLDNVDPLLKVTHTPSLQARIIEAVGDLTALDAPSEALMFSIYCVAILSLDEERCRTLFGPKRELLTGYRFACRQALINCRVLRTDDHDTLVALFLYLESENASCATALEAEMRRRLWWALVIFDSRIDFELLPGTKSTPQPSHVRPTEALYVVVRGELGEFIRHSPFYLNFIDPLLTSFADAKGTLGGRDLPDLQKALEDSHLRYCDPDNPLHFMTIWTARSYIAKNLLLEHCSKQHPATPAIISHCLTMLECDTKLLTSPLTGGFRWQTKFHFPFLAYAYIFQHFKKQPQDITDEVWEAVDENYEARGITRWGDAEPGGDTFFALFSRMVMPAWKAREAFLRQQQGRGDASLENRPPLPQIVVKVKAKIERMRSQQLGVSLQVNASGQALGNLDLGGISLNENLAGDSGVSAGPAFTASAPTGMGGFSGTGMGNDALMGGMDIAQFWPVPVGWGMMQNPLW